MFTSQHVGPQPHTHPSVYPQAAEAPTQQRSSIKHHDSANHVEGGPFICKYIYMSCNISCSTARTTICSPKNETTTVLIVTVVVFAIVVVKFAIANG